MRARIGMIALAALVLSATPEGAEGGTTRKMVCRDPEGGKRVIFLPKSCEETYAAYARTDSVAVKGSISVALQNLQITPQLSGAVVHAKAITRLGDLYDQLTSQQRMQLTAFCQSRLMDPCDRELQRTTDDRVQEWGTLLANLRTQIGMLAQATTTADPVATEAAYEEVEEIFEEAMDSDVPVDGQ